MRETECGPAEKGEERRKGRKKRAEGGFRFEQQQVPLELDKQTPGRCKCLFVL